MSAAYRLSITEKAKGDLEAIWVYISKDSPSRASDWIEALESKIHGLSRQPQRCPEVPEIADVGKGYRHLVHGDYRIVFRVEEDVVNVIRVVHGAMLLDIEAILHHEE